MPTVNTFEKAVVRRISDQKVTIKANEVELVYANDTASSFQHFGLVSDIGVSQGRIVVGDQRVAITSLKVGVEYWFGFISYAELK